jgi:hypothetical protein
VTHPFHFALCQEVKGPFDSTHWYCGEHGEAIFSSPWIRMETSSAAVSRHVRMLLRYNRYDVSEQFKIILLSEIVINFESQFVHLDTLSGSTDGRCFKCWRRCENWFLAMNPYIKVWQTDEVRDRLFIQKVLKIPIDNQSLKVV